MAAYMNLPTGTMAFRRWLEYRNEYPDFSTASVGTTGMRYQCIYAYPAVPSEPDSGTDVLFSGAWDENGDYYFEYVYPKAYR